MPAGPSSAAKVPSPAAIREQLERMLEAAEFRANERRRRFLHYVVEETLAGRALGLKGYTIALSVMGRDESFDPQADPIVRLEARQLRRDLEHYYLSAGRSDPVRIEIRKGSYVPTFELTEVPKPADLARSWAALDIHPPAKQTVGRDVPTIAVLPVVNLTGVAAEDVFACGITVEVINALSLARRLFAISQAVGAPDPHAGNDLRVVGRDLGASFVLTGNLRRGADRVRVGAELHDVQTAEVVWSGRFDQTASAIDLLDLQDAIARQVASALARVLACSSHASEEGHAARGPLHP